MKRKLLVAIGSTLSFLSLPISVFAQTYDKTLDSTYSRSLPSDFATSTFFAMYFLLMCVILGVWVAICVWVYKDAKKHNSDNPGLWVLLVLLMSLPGLVLYLLLGRKK